MITQSYIHIALPHIGEGEWLNIKESLESGWLTQGPKVSEFEKRFATIHNADFALATTSCTTSLHLALKAIGIKENDIVIVPSFTWIATANAVEYCNAIPVFCDVDRKTYNIDPEKLEETIISLINKGKHPKAVIPVHLFGLCANMDKINEIAVEYNLKVIEDAACAVGAKYGNRFAGTFGDIGCFSFHPRKIITTGEGGMCVTNSQEYFEKMNCLRNHGASTSEEVRHHGNKPYLMPDFEELGYNYRMTDLQGSVGLIQLDKLDFLLSERRLRAKKYDEELASIEWISTPFVPENYFHSYQSYVCFVEEEKIGKSRNEIMEILHRKGIATRPGTHAVHKQKYYLNKYKIKANDYPVSSELYAKTMAIPLHNKMNENDYDYIIHTLKEI